MRRTLAPAASLCGIPLGIWVASTSRESSICSFEIILLFARNRFLLALERGIQRMPCQRGAFDPQGKLRYSGKNSQLTQVFLVALRVACDHVVKFGEELFRFGCRLPF